MDFFETVKKRRSIRKFTKEVFPPEAIERALEAAILAPNSSNTQTWDFHWIQSEEIRGKVVECCLNQSAARTATQLLVISVEPDKWRRSIRPLQQWVETSNAPKIVHYYYKKLIPFTYSWGYLMTPIKALLAYGAGLFRPIMRTPIGRKGLEEVAIKSAALAAENFVLAITAQGGATCMMEGFDEWRLRRVLKLPYRTRIVMCIGIGYESERGTWGAQMRLPLEKVLHRI